MMEHQNKSGHIGGVAARLQKDEPTAYTCQTCSTYQGSTRAS